MLNWPGALILICCEAIACFACWCDPKVTAPGGPTALLAATTGICLFILIGFYRQDISSLRYRIPAGAESKFVLNTNKLKPAIRIDPTDTFTVQLDLSAYVKKVSEDYGCTKCEAILIRIEPDGILGRELTDLDTAVIFDHHEAKHNG